LGRKGTNEESVIQTDWSLNAKEQRVLRGKNKRNQNIKNILEGEDQGKHLASGSHKRQKKHRPQGGNQNEEENEKVKEKRCPKRGTRTLLSVS